MSHKPKSKRRNMKSFKLSEISVVDKPAQEGAKMALMKRTDSDPTEVLVLKHYLDHGSFAKYAMESVTKSAGNDVAKTCWPALAALETSLRSIVRDASLDDTGKVEMMKSSVKDFLTFTKQRLPEIEPHLLKVVSDIEDDEMNLRQLQKQMTALNSKLDNALATLAKAEGGEGEVSKLRSVLAGDIEKDDGGTEKAVEDMPYSMMGTAGTEKAEGDEEEEMYPEEGEETEKQDEESTNEKPTSEGEEEEFISSGSPTPIGGKRATKRDQISEDDILYVGDRVIHKSAVDPDLFTVLKSQQLQVQAQALEVERLAKAAQDERDLRELVEFAKVAEEQLEHLPGTVEEKASILKRLSKALPQNERIVLSRMLKAGNAGVSQAFESLGHRVGKASTSDFTKRVTEVRARDNCSQTEAMQKARREFPDDYAAYQGH